MISGASCATTSRASSPPRDDPSLSSTVKLATEMRPTQPRRRLVSIWYRTGIYGCHTIGGLLAERSRRYRDVPMRFKSLVDSSSASVGEVLRRAASFAFDLRDLGVGPGEPVAVKLPNGLECAVAYHAVWLAGGILVPVPPSYGAAETGAILRSAKPILMIADDAELLALAQHFQRSSFPPVTTVSVPLAAPSLALGGRKATVLPEARDCGPDDPCLIVHTSGTTATPKGVVHTHNSILAELLSRGTSPGRSYLQTYPPGHIAGTLGILTAPLLGVPTTFLERWSAGDTLDLVAKSKFDSSRGTPFYLGTLLDHAEARGVRNLGIVDYALGATSVNPGLVERADRLGVVAYRSYGCTEQPTVTSGHPTESIEHRSRTEGRPQAGNQVRILDGDLREVLDGEEGEIVTIGPDQFVGYLGEEPGVFTEDGWFRTGDLGRLSEGYLLVTGRMKDVVIRGGENISPSLVEAVLESHPAVREAAVIGVQDEIYGERICAVVVLVPGAEVDLELVRCHFWDSGTSRHAVPEYLEVVADLPHTAAGKVDKARLRVELAAAGLDCRPSSSRVDEHAEQ